MLKIQGITLMLLNVFISGKICKFFAMRRPSIRTLLLSAPLLLLSLLIRKGIIISISLLSRVIPRMWWSSTTPGTNIWWILPIKDTKRLKLQALPHLTASSISWEEQSKQSTSTGSKIAKNNTPASQTSESTPKHWSHSPSTTSLLNKSSPISHTPKFYSSDAEAQLSSLILTINRIWSCWMRSSQSLPKICSIESQLIRKDW